MSHREKILAKVGTVESLPVAAIEALDLLQDPDADIAAVTKTIEYDPGLTSNLLRLANSSYFGSPRSINSVRDAIVRLGTKQVLRTITASATASLMNGAVKGYDLPSGELWEHSIGVAVASDQLASVLDVDAPAYMFTAALLHDVGKIVLGTFVEIDTSSIMKLAFDEHVPFEVAERRVLGIDHTEVGGILLDSWNLPVEIVQVCRWHHEPENVVQDTCAVDIVHMADNLALMYGIGTGSDGLNYRPSREVVSRLNVNIHVMEEAACRVLEAVQELRSTFAISMG
jgi:putative nucleotidyltransferase with HDIG domain